MKYLTSLLLFLPFLASAQDYQAKTIDYENIDLHPPMKIELILAGNFGEMRSNHFHTGLDIKTKSVVGQKIYAVEDGYISRARVSPWGYGLALYIDHPSNGLTSLYAHLSKFTPSIDSLVYSYQKKNESYIVDEVALADSFFVKKGQLIGYSGNSGSSFAPHLHFELRETSTEHALNPLLFKCYQSKIKDTTVPQIKGIKIYAVSEKGYMIPGKSKYYTCKLKNNQWVLNDNNPIDVKDLFTENSYLALGFHVTDRLDAAGNVCGVYNTQLSKDDLLIHEQKTEYMNFDHNRFLNSHQDYAEFHDRKKNVHKNFKTVVNPLPIYPTANGIIPWDKCAGQYQFDAFDAYGNKVHLSFTLKKSESTPAKNPFDVANKYLFPDSTNAFLRESFQLLMEPGTFYEPIQKIYKIDSNSTYLSVKHKFSEYSIPIQKYFDVRIKTSNLPEDFPVYKLGIGRISDRGYLSFIGGQYIDGWVETTSRSFGTFVLVVDTIAPIINPSDFNEGKVVTKYNNLQLEIMDNLSGVKTYKAYLNGKWVLMEYDRKKRKYIIPFSKYTRPLLRQGKNKIRIYAKDRKGNESESSYTIIY